MGKLFLHNIHIPVIVGQNEQSQSEPCEEKVFCIPLKTKKNKKNLKTEVVIKLWFDFFETDKGENTTVF